jgi:hypothetical protein
MYIIGIIGVIIGLCLFSPLASIQNKQNRCSSYTMGKIVFIDIYLKRRRFRRVRYYIPTVKFEVNGIGYDVKYNRSPDADEYQIGDSFWVMYNPQNPYEISQDDDLLSIKGEILAFIGSWIIVLSFIFMISLR